ncbi:MAG: peptide ABC transporter ATP-binding protein [Planctomycetia bacterium TMED53]|nr:MAG: peptide ABC transporter ATP-binding protein [Planctomycetia bacterium TMED53]
MVSVRDLHTDFTVEGKTAQAVDGVSFDIMPGEVLGLVGESGCGKSVTALSLLKLIPDPPGKIRQGSAIFRGRDLLALDYGEMRKIRGNEIAMIFQEPMTALNPVFTIGFQMREAIQHHAGASKDEANNRAVEMLEKVGIPDARARLDNYPHQFSGGMRQRVMIAMALSLQPALLIADEPTTALDVTIQAQILDLMLEMKSQQEGASILLITHDLAVVAETCDRVVVMYGGKIQEVAPVRELFRNPLHPYTQGLLRSLPRPELEEQQEELETIPGIVPSIFDWPPGCRFSTRCPFVEDRCREEVPELREVGDGHWVRCHVAETPKGASA